MKHLIRPLALLGWLLTTAVPARLQADGDETDRGDVPGWVMLTLMSAVLVAGLLLIARPALEGLFQDAINRVSGL
ncbi:MAG: hypothetical protein Q4C90_02475 [Kocuria sp.]|uniref:hypothetical protein n=1 Tax=Kocuria TaxID=57493 RepID=UPI00119D2B2B|nr:MULTISPECIES: hypothetical protein [Kocuria]MDO4256026.1 hypothetical protein [Kocuria sp.]